jgi:transcription initiation factor TFIIB
MILSMVKEIVSNNGKCPRCGKNKLITDSESSEIFCSNCGIVLSEKIQELGNKIRIFTQEDFLNKSRTGGPSSIAIHDMGLSTVISPINKDSLGRSLKNSMKNKMRQLRLLDSRSQNTKPIDINRRRAFEELQRLKGKLALPDAVIERTAYIYRKALDHQLVRGRTISSMLASAVYVACRDTGRSRTLRDIAEATNLKRKEISRGVRVLIKGLEIRMEVVDPAYCVSRISSILEISEKANRFAIEILRKAEHKRIIYGKDPMGMAACALYIACVKLNENHSQKEIALAAGVTEVTVRNRYRELSKALAILDSRE